MAQFLEDVIRVAPNFQRSHVTIEQKIATHRLTHKYLAKEENSIRSALQKIRRAVAAASSSDSDGDDSATDATAAPSRVNRPSRADEALAQLHAEALGHIAGNQSSVADESAPGRQRHASKQSDELASSLKYLHKGLGNRLNVFLSPSARKRRKRGSDSHAHAITRYRAESGVDLLDDSFEKAFNGSGAATPPQRPPMLARWSSQRLLAHTNYAWMYDASMGYRPVRVLQRHEDAESSSGATVTCETVDGQRVRCLSSQVFGTVTHYSDLDAADHGDLAVICGVHEATVGHTIAARWRNKRNTSRANRVTIYERPAAVKPLQPFALFDSALSQELYSLRGSVRPPGLQPYVVGAHLDGLAPSAVGSAEASHAHICAAIEQPQGTQHGTITPVSHLIFTTGAHASGKSAVFEACVQHVLFADALHTRQRVCSAFGVICTPPELSNSFAAADVMSAALFALRSFTCRSRCHELGPDVPYSANEASHAIRFEFGTTNVGVHANGSLTTVSCASIIDATVKAHALPAARLHAWLSCLQGVSLEQHSGEELLPPPLHALAALACDCRRVEDALDEEGKLYCRNAWAAISSASTSTSSFAWPSIEQALRVCGYTDDDITSIAQAISAAVLLSQIRFEKQPEQEHDAVAIADVAFRSLAQLSALTEQELQHALRYKRLVVDGEILALRLTAADAERMCISAATALLLSVVSAVEASVNAALQQCVHTLSHVRAACDLPQLPEPVHAEVAPRPRGFVASLTLIDTSGICISQSEASSFADLCRNFEFERVCARVCELLIVDTANAYAAQELHWATVAYPSPAMLLEMLSTPKEGILDTICASDIPTAIEDFTTAWAAHPCVRRRNSSTVFQVVHSFGSVSYDFATLASSVHHVPPDSALAALAKLTGRLKGNSRGRAKAHESPPCDRFRSQLELLMHELSHAAAVRQAGPVPVRAYTHPILCIAPHKRNHGSDEHTHHDSFVLAQLQLLNVYDIIRCERQTHAVSLPHEVFCRCFSVMQAARMRKVFDVELEDVLAEAFQATQSDARLAAMLHVRKHIYASTDNAGANAPQSAEGMRCAAIISDCSRVCEAFQYGNAVAGKTSVALSALAMRTLAYAFSHVLPVYACVCIQRVVRGFLDRQLVAAVRAWVHRTRDAISRSDIDTLEECIAESELFACARLELRAAVTALERLRRERQLRRLVVACVRQLRAGGLSELALAPAALPKEDTRELLQHLDVDVQLYQRLQTTLQQCSAAGMDGTSEIAEGWALLHACRVRAYVRIRLAKAIESSDESELQQTLEQASAVAAEASTWCQQQRDAVARRSEQLQAETSLTSSLCSSVAMCAFTQRAPFDWHAADVATVLHPSAEPAAVANSITSSNQSLARLQQLAPFVSATAAAAAIACDCAATVSQALLANDWNALGEAFCRGHVAVTLAAFASLHSSYCSQQAHEELQRACEPHAHRLHLPLPHLQELLQRFPPVVAPLAGCLQAFALWRESVRWQQCVVQFVCTPGALPGDDRDPSAHLLSSQTSDRLTYDAHVQWVYSAGQPGSMGCIDWDESYRCAMGAVHAIRAAMDPLGTREPNEAQQRGEQWLCQTARSDSTRLLLQLFTALLALRSAVRRGDWAAAHDAADESEIACGKAQLCSAECLWGVGPAGLFSHVSSHAQHVRMPLHEVYTAAHGELRAVRQLLALARACRSLSAPIVSLLPVCAHFEALACGSCGVRGICSEHCCVDITSLLHPLPSRQFQSLLAVVAQLPHHSLLQPLLDRFQPNHSLSEALCTLMECLQALSSLCAFRCDATALQQTAAVMAQLHWPDACLDGHVVAAKSSPPLALLTTWLQHALRGNDRRAIVRASLSLKAQNDVLQTRLVTHLMPNSQREHFSAPLQWYYAVGSPFTWDALEAIQQSHPLSLYRCPLLRVPLTSFVDAVAALNEPDALTRLSDIDQTAAERVKQLIRGLQWSDASAALSSCTQHVVDELYINAALYAHVFATEAWNQNAPQQSQNQLKRWQALKWLASIRSASSQLENCIEFFCCLNGQADLVHTMHLTALASSV